MATNRFSLKDPVGNLKKGFTNTDNLIDDASALLTVLWYIAIPTLLKLSGWLGWAVGTIVPYIVGKLINAPGMCSSAIGIGTVHVMYAKFSNPNGGATDGMLNKLFGRPIWDFEAPKTQSNTSQTNATIPINTQQTYQDTVQTLVPPTQVNGISDTYVLPTGEVLEAYNPNYIQNQIEQHPMSGLDAEYPSYNTQPAPIKMTNLYGNRTKNRRGMFRNAA